MSAHTIASFGTISEEQAADGIIVLGAAVIGNQPSPVFRERINHAIKLYEQGYAPVIIFTGGGGDRQQQAEAEVARLYAERHGVPAENMLIETISKTTEQNLYFAKQLMDKQHLETAIIVSDPLHMKRAMTIAKDMEIVGYSSPTPTSRYKSQRTRS